LPERIVGLIDRRPICRHADRYLHGDVMESGLVNTIALDLDTGKIADFGFTVGISLMATTITHRVLGSDAARRRLTGSPR